jgi:hypothetical protein
MIHISIFLNLLAYRVVVEFLDEFIMPGSAQDAFLLATSVASLRSSSPR